MDSTCCVTRNDAAFANLLSGLPDRRSLYGLVAKKGARVYTTYGLLARRCAARNTDLYIHAQRAPYHPSTVPSPSNINNLGTLPTTSPSPKQNLPASLTPQLLPSLQSGPQPAPKHKPQTPNRSSQRLLSRRLDSKAPRRGYLC